MRLNMNEILYDGFEEDLRFIYDFLVKIDYLSSIKKRGYRRRMYEIRKLLKPAILRLVAFYGPVIDWIGNICATDEEIENDSEDGS